MIDVASDLAEWPRGPTRGDQCQKNSTAYAAMFQPATNKGNAAEAATAAREALACGAGPHCRVCPGCGRTTTATNSTGNAGTR
jgi:hypothetical protein